MNELKLPNIFITSLSEEVIFNPDIIGWDGLALFRYLVRECWKTGKVVLTDLEIERMFSIAEKRRAKLKKLFRDQCLVRIDTGGQKYNTTTYAVDFKSLSDNPPTLLTIYRHGEGGLSNEKLEALATQYGEMDIVQQELLAKYEVEPTKPELWKMVGEMNQALNKHASSLRSSVDPSWQAEPFKLVGDPTTLRLIRGILRYHTKQNILLAFDIYAEYMTFKRYGVEQEDWLKAKEVPANIFKYFAAFNKKKPYDVIQRCLTYKNTISTFDKRR